MKCKQKAIALSYIRYKEHSIIARVYTELLGLQSFLVRGVRKKSNQHIQIGYFYPLSILEIVFHYRPLSQLQHIQELSSAYVYRSVPFVIEKQPYVSLICALLERLLEPYDEPQLRDPRFFFVLRSCWMFDQIEQASAFFGLQFLAKLTYFVGIGLREESLKSFARTRHDRKVADSLTTHILEAYHLPYDLKVDEKKRPWALEGIHLLLHYYEARWFTEGSSSLSSTTSTLWKQLTEPSPS